MPRLWSGLGRFGTPPEAEYCLWAPSRKPCRGAEAARPRRPARRRRGPVRDPLVLRQAFGRQGKGLQWGCALLAM
eukprot:3563125-Heterocapsa_arctica.AAC.1